MNLPINYNWNCTKIKIYVGRLGNWWVRLEFSVIKNFWCFKVGLKLQDGLFVCLAQRRPMFERAIGKDEGFAESRGRSMGFLCNSELLNENKCEYFGVSTVFFFPLQYISWWCRLCFLHFISIDFNCCFCSQFDVLRTDLVYYLA